MLELTVRGNVQIRGLAAGAEHELAVLLRAAGLLPSESHDRVRNIMASPATGLGGADVGPVVAELDAALVADPVLAGLPGRFLFAVDDGSADVGALGADVGLFRTDHGYAVPLAGTLPQLWVSAQQAVPAALQAAHAFLTERQHQASSAWRLSELADGPTRVAAAVAAVVPGSSTGPTLPAGALDRPRVPRPGLLQTPDGRGGGRGGRPGPAAADGRRRRVGRSGCGERGPGHPVAQPGRSTAGPRCRCRGRVVGAGAPAGGRRERANQWGQRSSERRGPSLRGPGVRFEYVRDGAEIYRRSFAMIRAEAALDDLPPDVARVAVRMIHSCGMTDLVADLTWSHGVVAVAREALLAGAPVLCDAQMVASGITRSRLPADNEIVCTLSDPRVPGLAKEQGNTRSAAAVDLWADRLAGAVVAIGNAPTALFRLLELLDAGAPRPAAVLGLPVGFVGAAESKEELIVSPHKLPYLVVRGRRGGSAMAVAAVNAIASEVEV